MPREHTDWMQGVFARGTTKQVGDRGEDMALSHLLSAGLTLVQRHYRTPGRGSAEIDLIMKERDGTLVFVEVRARSSMRQGGAAVTIGRAKQQRIVRAAKHFLLRCPVMPPCRFDVVVADPCGVQWLPAAFDLG